MSIEITRLHTTIKDKFINYIIDCNLRVEEVNTLKKKNKELATHNKIDSDEKMASLVLEINRLKITCKEK